MFETVLAHPQVYAFASTETSEFLPICMTALRLVERPKLIGLVVEGGRVTQTLRDSWERDVQKRFPEAPLLILHGASTEWTDIVESVLEADGAGLVDRPTTVLLGMEGLEPETRKARRALDRLAAVYPYTQFLAYRPDWAAHPPRIH